MPSCLSLISAAILNSYICSSSVLRLVGQQQYYINYYLSGNDQKMVCSSILLPKLIQSNEIANKARIKSLEIVVNVFFNHFMHDIFHDGEHDDRLSVLTGIYYVHVEYVHTYMCRSRRSSWLGLPTKDMLHFMQTALCQLCTAYLNRFLYPIMNSI